MEVSIPDVQSLIQLSIALNFAFTAFEAIKYPIQSKMRRLADESLRRSRVVETELGAMHKIVTLGWPVDLADQFRGRSSDYSKALVHSANLHGYDTAYDDNNEDFSSWIGRFAILIGLIGILLLFATPMLKTVMISYSAYLFFSCFLFLPAVLFIFYNWSISRLMRKDVLYIREIECEIDQIESRLREKYRPVVKRAKEEGYLK